MKKNRSWVDLILIIWKILVNKIVLNVTLQKLKYVLKKYFCDFWGGSDTASTFGGGSSYLSLSKFKPTRRPIDKYLTVDGGMISNFLYITRFLDVTLNVCRKTQKFDVWQFQNKKPMVRQIFLYRQFLNKWKIFAML